MNSNQTKPTGEWVDVYRKDRILYVLEAAFEYFLSIMLAGAYIAKVGTALGMSTATIGIVTSMTNLGAAFQALALFMKKSGPIKRKVLLFHTINQVCFSLTWLIPSIPMGDGIRITVFIAVLLTGHILNNAINSPKIAWYMGMVDDRKRGVFTAEKEMVSLVGGMIFSFAMGLVIDRFEAEGRLTSAFLIGGFTMVGITVLHTVTLLLTKDRAQTEQTEQIEVRKTVSELFRNRFFVRVLILTLSCKLLLSISIPFYGSYVVNELGFSMVYIAVLDVVYAVIRCIASVFLGRIADRFGFVRMFRACILFATLAFAVMIFAVPANGKWVYMIYYGVFYAAFGAGYANSMMNLVYDTVHHSQRTAAFAVYSAVSGIVGFLTTLAISPLVDLTQKNGNRIFGMELYVQQGLSAIAVLAGVLVLFLSYKLVSPKTTGLQK